MNDIFQIFLIITMWVALSMVVGTYARRHNLGFAGGFIISLFLSPFVGLIITLATPEINPFQSDFSRLAESAGMLLHRKDPEGARQKYMDMLFLAKKRKKMKWQIYAQTRINRLDKHLNSPNAEEHYE